MTIIILSIIFGIFLLANKGGGILKGSVRVGFEPTVVFRLREFSKLLL